MKKFKKNIIEFAEDLCDLLGIDCPEIRFTTEGFKTKTMMALFDGECMKLRPVEGMNPDTMFSIAHELRHVWQKEYHDNIFFANYKQVNEVDIVTYNKQLAEVDANAFAGIVMENYFCLTPQFNGMDESVKEMIRRRMELLNPIYF